MLSAQLSMKIKPWMKRTHYYNTQETHMVITIIKYSLMLVGAGILPFFTARKGSNVTVYTTIAWYLTIWAIFYFFIETH